MAAMTVSTEAALADLHQMFPDYDKTALAAVLEVCRHVSVLLLLARVESIAFACLRVFVSPLLSGPSATSTTSARRWLLLTMHPPFSFVVGMHPCDSAGGTEDYTE